MVSPTGGAHECTGAAGSGPVPAAEVERLLREVALILRQRGRQHLSSFDITPPQFDALVELVRDGDMTMGELCNRLSLASSTVTDLIDRMERSGFVRRIRDTGDRRVVRLRVLERGRAVIDAVLRTRSAYLETVLKQMAPEAQRRVAQAVRLLHDHMTRPGRFWHG